MFILLQLNKANSSGTQTSVLDFNLLISNDIISSEHHDKRDDFDFDIVNIPFF